MTNKVNKSTIRGLDFPVLVEDHAKEMTAWREHQKLVADGKAQHYPAPASRPDVVASIRLDEKRGIFVPDFEIVDDGPTAAQILRAKKNELLNTVTHLEQQAAEAIVAPGKRRLLAIRHRTVTAKPEKERSREDVEFLKEHAALLARLNAVELHGATQHDIIEDLTVENVDDWKPEPFPT